MSNLSKALGDKFTFTIANATAGAVVIALFAAFFDTLKLTEGTPNTIAYTNPAAIVAAGFTCDHVLDDGTIATNITATSANSKRSIRQLREYVKLNGVKVTDMSVQASNVAAFNEVLEVVTVTPLNGPVVQELSLNQFRSEYQSANDKISVKDLGLVLDCNKLVMLRVQAGHSVTLNLQFEPQV